MVEIRGNNDDRPLNSSIVCSFEQMLIEALLKWAFYKWEDLLDLLWSRGEPGGHPLFHFTSVWWCLVAARSFPPNGAVLGWSSKWLRLPSGRGRSQVASRALLSHLRELAHHDTHACPHARTHVHSHTHARKRARACVCEQSYAQNVLHNFQARILCFILYLRTTNTLELNWLPLIHGIVTNVMLTSVGCVVSCCLAVTHLKFHMPRVFVKTYQLLNQSSNQRSETNTNPNNVLFAAPRQSEMC